MAQDPSFEIDYQKWTISEYLAQICAGRYGLPEFQRTFVWDEDQVLDLWTSLHQGIPVGQLLLWQTPEEWRAQFPMRPLARIQSQMSPEEASCVTTCIVDGQQRLSAIFLAMRGELENPLFFDLETERFVYSRAAGSVIGLNVLATQPFDDARDNDWFRYLASDAQKKTYARALNRLNAVLTQPTLCQIPAQVIKFADYDRVTDIFRRVNIGGTKLSDAQIALAGISKRWKGVFQRTFDTLTEMDREIAFGGMKDPDFVMLAWTAVHTGTHKIEYLAPSDRSKFARLATAEKYKESWEALETGLRRLTALLKHRLYLDNFQFVRAAYPLVVAARFLAGHAPTEDDEARLAHWIVASILSGRYSQRGTTRLREDIRYSGRDYSLRDLFSHGEALDPSAHHIQDVRLAEEVFRAGSSPYGALLYMLMRKRSAIDFYVPSVRVGDRTCPTSQLDKYLFRHTADAKELYGLYDQKQDGYAITWHFHHIFPQALFKGVLAALEQRKRAAEEDENETQAKSIQEEADSLKKKISSVANLGFLLPPTNILIGAKPPREYLDGLLRLDFPELGISGREILERQFVPLDRQLWEVKEFDGFCAERERLIKEAAREDGLVELGEELMLPIDQADGKVNIRPEIEASARRSDRAGSEDRFFKQNWGKFDPGDITACQVVVGALERAGIPGLVRETLPSGRPVFDLLDTRFGRVRVLQVSRVAPSLRDTPDKAGRALTNTSAAASWKAFQGRLRSVPGATLGGTLHKRVHVPVRALAGDGAKVMIEALSELAAALRAG